MSLRVEAGFEHLREAMAEAIEREVEFAPGILVTVLAAKVTANTAHAKVVLSVFPETAKEFVLEQLRASEREIKHHLSAHLRLRRIPRLHYTFDDTEADAADIEAELYRLKQQGDL